MGYSLLSLFCFPLISFAQGETCTSYGFLLHPGFLFCSILVLILVHYSWKHGDCLFSPDLGGSRLPRKPWETQLDPGLL